jgi:dihydrofolate reductase
MEQVQEVIIIAAMARNRVIGKNNSIPWNFKEDLRHFRELTMGCPCIMGRRTWESLPIRPLPGRFTVVISSKSQAELGIDFAGTEEAGAAALVPSLEAGLARCKDAPRIFICGGAGVYRRAMAFATRIELTVLNRDYEGDVFFPDLDLRLWKQSAAEDHGEFAFFTFTRIQARPSPGL